MQLEVVSMCSKYFFEYFLFINLMKTLKRFKAPEKLWHHDEEQKAPTPLTNHMPPRAQKTKSSKRPTGNTRNHHFSS